MLRRGVFAVVKPSGITSAKVTSRLKYILTEEARKSTQLEEKFRIKVGHGGTLDRSATGVLVIGLGDDCKLLTALLHCDKTYECVGNLGAATDTLDGDGKIIEERPYDHVSESLMSQALREKFTGTITQTPPVFSAIKKGGKRSSDLARQGISVDLPSRKVTIHSIRVLDFSPPFFRLSIHCSSGTYVRSIVDDLAKSLGSAAHVSQLSRTRQGPFSLEQALPQDKWTYCNIKVAVEKSKSFFMKNYHNRESNYNTIIQEISFKSGRNKKFISDEIMPYKNNLIYNMYCGAHQLR